MSDHQPDAQPEPVSPHVWRIPVRSHTLPPATHTNIYIVGAATAPGAAPAGVVVWDAGAQDADGVAAVEAQLTALGHPPVEALVIGHGHPDHTDHADALQALCGAPVRAHALVMDKLAKQFPTLPLGGALADGDALAPGGVRMEILHTPGHARGHLAGWIPADGVVLAGDLLAGEGTIAIIPPEGDLGDYLRSLARLAALRPEMAAPGHGPLLRPALAAIREIVHHRAERERQILACLAGGGDSGSATPRACGGRTVAQLVDVIYGDTVTDFVRPFAEATVRAHLAKLLEEGRVRRTASTGGRDLWQGA